MTIQITKPEVEALIKQRLKSGVFKDAEDVILQALQSSSPAYRDQPSEKCLEQVFESVRGLADDLDCGRKSVLRASS